MLLHKKLFINVNVVRQFPKVLWWSPLCNLK